MPVTTPRLNPSWPAHVALAVAALLGAHTSAHAEWYASASVDNEVGLRVGSAAGSYTWTTLKEGWAASYSTDGTLARNFVFQSWDGSAWPTDFISGELDLPGGGLAQAGYVHSDTSSEQSWYGKVSVMGPLGNGQTAGAFLLYDFTLVVAPFSTVQVLHEADQHAVELGHDAGDQGFGFGSVKLYDSALDLNVAGGANRPYFDNLLTLAGGAAADSLLGGMGELSYTFRNATAQAQTHQLRLELSAMVFTQAVPEPQTWALWLAGLGGLGALARRRAFQA